MFTKDGKDWLQHCSSSIQSAHPSKIEIKVKEKTGRSNKRQKLEIYKQKGQTIERVACNVVLHQAFFSTSQPFQACISVRILLGKGSKNYRWLVYLQGYFREGVKKLSVACRSAKVFVVGHGCGIIKMILTVCLYICKDLFSYIQVDHLSR